MLPQVSSAALKRLRLNKMKITSFIVLVNFTSQPRNLKSVASLIKSFTRLKHLWKFHLLNPLRQKMFASCLSEKLKKKNIPAT